MDWGHDPGILKLLNMVIPTRKGSVGLCHSQVPTNLIPCWSAGQEAFQVVIPQTSTYSSDGNTSSEGLGKFPKGDTLPEGRSLTRKCNYFLADSGLGKRSTGNRP